MLALCDNAGEAARAIYGCLIQTGPLRGGAKYPLRRMVQGDRGDRYSPLARFDP